jgi:serine/threonine protein kinase/DNA-binding beta-propeller fold protein YncE
MSTSREVSPGQVLGTCRILEQIGQGGMGTVYRAFQPSLDRVVAVKVISPVLVGDDTALERFRREAQTVASFRHPNILTVYDFGEQDGVTYLVSEFAAGGTLRSRMGTPLTLADAVAVLRPVAGALDYAHARGVVHRDVKPANVLIHADGSLVLSDFGLALQPSGIQLQQLTASGLLVGTPTYMAPEQGRSSQVGPSADLYALGVIAYELLSGSVPFSGETPLSIMLAHIQDPLPPVRERNPALPQAVEAVLQQALAKQPEQRFASGEALVQALQDAANAPAIVPPPEATVQIRTPVEPTAPEADQPGSGQSSGSSRPRTPWLAVAAAILLLAAAGIVLLRATPIISGVQPQPTPIGLSWQVVASTSVDHFNTLAVDRSGFIYMVADDHRIQKLSPAGQPVAGPWGTSGGPVAFDQPRGLTLSHAGDLYVTEAGSAQRVQHLAPFAPDWLQTLGRWGAPGVNAGQFSSPSGVAVADDGTIYIADTDNSRIQKLSSSGQPLAQWGSLGTDPGQFSAPLGVAVDRQGNVYVADTVNDRIQKLSPDGKSLAQWGSHGTEPGQFSSPSGLAVADDGSIFVADTNNARVQWLSPEGRYRAAFGSANPDAAEGPFNTPISVALDPTGVLYVLDSGNHRILKSATVALPTGGQPPG